MISIEDLRVHLRAGVSDDGYIEALEVGAVAHVERETGRYFGAVASDTEYLVGTGGVKLWLKEAPDETTNPVAVNEAANPGATQTTITAGNDDGFLVRGPRLVRKNGFAWTLGYEYEVAYDRGYAAGSEPDDIRQAVQAIVGLWYERRVPLPKIGEIVTATVPHHAQAILNSWTRLHV